MRLPGLEKMCKNAHTHFERMHKMRQKMRKLRIWGEMCENAHFAGKIRKNAKNISPLPVLQLSLLNGSAMTEHPNLSVWGKVCWQSQAVEPKRVCIPGHYEEEIKHIDGRGWPPRWRRKTG